MRKRNIQKIVRFSRDEAQDLQKKAKKACLSEAGLIRLLLRGYEPREKPDERFYDDDRTHLRKKAKTKMSDDELSKVKEQISTVSDKIRELNKEVRLCNDIAERSKVMEQNLETIRAEEEKQQRKEQKRNDKFR